MKRALADVGSQHMGAACSLFRGKGSCVQCSNGAVFAVHVAAALRGGVLLEGGFQETPSY